MTIAMTLAAIVSVAVGLIIVAAIVLIVGIIGSMK